MFNIGEKATITPALEKMNGFFTAKLLEFAGKEVTICQRLEINNKIFYLIEEDNKENKWSENYFIPKVHYVYKSKKEIDFKKIVEFIRKRDTNTDFNFLKKYPKEIHEIDNRINLLIAKIYSLYNAYWDENIEFYKKNISGTNLEQLLIKLYNNPNINIKKEILDTKSEKEIMDMIKVKEELI